MIRILILVLVMSLARVARAQSDCWTDALVAIVAKGGQFMSPSALQPFDLAAKVNGKPVSVSLVEPEGDKTTVVLFIDTSGSMIDAAQSELEVARGIVAALPPSQPTMLVAFAEKSEVVASDHAGTARWLQTITGLKQDRRRTALWDAIDKALSTISSPHPIFIVLGDGADDISKVHAEVLEQKLQQSDIRMIWVETRSDEPGTPEERLGAEKTAQVAVATGGFAIPSKHGFGRSLPTEQAKLAADAVRAYFHVRIALPPNVHRSGKLRISVASNRTELKAAQLAYNERLGECSSLPASH